MWPNAELLAHPAGAEREFSTANVDLAGCVLSVPVPAGRHTVTVG